MDELSTPIEKVNTNYHASKVPNFITPGVVGIDFDALKNHGVRHLVFDVDNTLVSYGAHELDQKIRDLLINLQESKKFATIRLATNSPRNLKWLRDELGLHISQPRPWRFKPMPGYFRHILKDIHDQPKSVAMIGDKLIQDIWGSNSVGMVSVLVQPLGQDSLIDRIFFFRQHEKHLLRKYIPQHIEKWF